MKTISIILTSLLFAAKMLALQPDKAVYVITKGDTIFCKTLHVGVFNTTLKFTGGRKVKVPNSEIRSLTVEGRRYDRFPVISNGKVGKGAIFMEVIAKRGSHLLVAENTPRSYFHSTQPRQYFVFRDGELVTDVNQRNARNIVAFFSWKNYKPGNTRKG